MPWILVNTPPSTAASRAPRTTSKPTTLRGSVRLRQHPNKRSTSPPRCPARSEPSPNTPGNFDDGRTGIGPGTPFTETHLPSRSPGYYLGATYTTPGTKHVTLTVTWRVTFRLEGVTDIPLTPIIMTATEDKQVATARAVLVN